MWQTHGKGTWWLHRREASLNWLAFGVLLAAWNTSSNDAPSLRRPEALRSYPIVSVRAAQSMGSRQRARDFIQY